MSAQVLLLLPQKQIVGCAGCSCSSPDVSPCVPAIDGWSKNSPCFPVYSLRLPLRSSWIKTAGLDKINFLFIALGVSMVMVERGWVDLNRPLVAVGGVTQGGFAEGGCLWPGWCPGHGCRCSLCPATLHHTYIPLCGRSGKRKRLFYLLCGTPGSFLLPWGFFPFSLSHLGC